MREFWYGILTGAILTGLTLFTGLLIFWLPQLCLMMIFIAVFPLGLVVFLFIKNEQLGIMLQFLFGFFVGTMIISLVWVIVEWGLIG